MRLRLVLLQQYESREASQQQHLEKTKVRGLPCSHPSSAITFSLFNHCLCISLFRASLTLVSQEYHEKREEDIARLQQNVASLTSKLRQQLTELVQLKEAAPRCAHAHPPARAHSHMCPHTLTCLCSRSSIGTPTRGGISGQHPVSELRSPSSAYESFRRASEDAHEDYAVSEEERLLREAAYLAADAPSERAQQPMSARLLGTPQRGGGVGAATPARRSLLAGLKEEDVTALLREVRRSVAEHTHRLSFSLSLSAFYGVLYLSTLSDIIVPLA